MRRRTALTALALGASALLDRPWARAQGTLERIQVVGPPAESATNLYYAIKTGMFARAGLDVVMVATGSGAVGTTAVITGTYELVRTSLLPLLSAHLRGIPLVAAGPSIVNTVRNPNGELQIAPDAPYKTGADLNGKTVGTTALGDINSLATRAWVDKTGGDWRSLKVVEVPSAAMEEAIVDHRVAAGIMQAPLLDASLAAGTTKTLAYAYGAIAPLFMGSAYVARRDWAAQHADALRRFDRILAEATTYVMAHPAETAPLVVEFTKIELANVAKMHRTVNATTLDPVLVQPVIDAAAKYEVISRSFPAREILWSG